MGWAKVAMPGTGMKETAHGRLSSLDLSFQNCSAAEASKTYSGRKRPAKSFGPFGGRKRDYSTQIKVLNQNRALLTVFRKLTPVLTSVRALAGLGIASSKFQFTNHLRVNKKFRPRCLDRSSLKKFNGPALSTVRRFLPHFHFGVAAF